MKKVRADELKGLIIEILKEREVEDSDVIADHFVEAELRGHSSHGIQRLVPLVKGIELGTISKRLRYEIIRQSGNSMWIDAKASIGIVLWTKLVEREFTSDPISIIAVKNSSHIGFLGYYTEKLGKRGLVGIMFGNAEPAVVMPGSSRKMLSTTPISISIPPSIVLDMALSATSRGKIIQALRRKEKIPLGLAVDENGNPTEDPERALRGGLSPIGGMKGFFLMLVLESLVSFLTGSALGSDVKGVLNTESPPNKGEVLIGINPSFFAGYREEIEKLRETLGIEFPGEHGLNVRAKRFVDGIPIDEELWNQLRKLSRK
ncbi:Ldh family oxidoreductase [Saccharolobus islandicus]|uniref:Malate/L-lactate dehydrogenase n=1 Tax=Saccharolobus islandicus LAL14/1 TaxID=1241935 RepID=M9U777_SACIS|nr:Ldh family oxidoreductase [Sulfolobus islandicus]AGJ61933.1 Malate/L-lactate dehydrogenase [Sulfolobus islandicus LAL14/1]